MDLLFSTSTSMSAARCLTPWYEPMGRPKAWRILAYSTVMSSTFCAPPHISAQSPKVARSITRESGFQPAPGAPMIASPARESLERVYYHQLRVVSSVGKHVDDSHGGYVD